MSTIKFTDEKILKPRKGVPMLIFLIIAAILSFALIIVSAALFIDEYNNLVVGIPLMVVAILAFITCCISFGGLKEVNPNEALVLSLFGEYYGTIYENGFWFVNPFVSAIYPQAKVAEAKSLRQSAYNQKKSQAEVSVSEAAVASAKKVSTKISTFVNGNQKVNDKLGNPVEVSAIVIWKVVNATKAVLNMENYKEFLSIQCDAITRNAARNYPYDTGHGSDEKTLRGSSQEIADIMQEELQKKVLEAGIEILDVRITHLAYAPEIASAMLQRQQAAAIIDARQKIVEGAVGMVEMALDQLSKNQIVELDEERKAAMVSNLLVVLCGNKDAQPIVNSGSIY